jgi:HlyD family secretion protein
VDKQRDPAILKRKKRRQVLLAAAAAVVIVALSVAVSQLEPALPTVAEAGLWPGTVKRGPMVREVRGSGRLVPEEIRWITASASGRVDRIVLQPGARVEPGTVILELANPDLQQSVRNAEMDWRTAVANLASQRATQATARLTQESALADNESAYQLAVTDFEMHRTLAAQGIVAGFQVKQKQAAVDQAKNRIETAKKQLAAAIQNEPLQLAPAEAAVNQRKAEFDRLSRQLDDSRRRFGFPRR